MPDIKISVPNMTQVVSGFRQFPDIVGPFLRAASMESAFVIERGAKILSPVDTGRMRASIATSLGVLDKGITSIVQTNVFYAIYVHDGMKGRRGRPFMKQAAEQNTAKIGEIFKKQATLALDKLASVSQ